MRYPANPLDFPRVCLHPIRAVSSASARSADHESRRNVCLRISGNCWLKATGLGDEERWFADFEIGDLFLSIQASPLHDCSPREMLDPKEYEAFEVHLQSRSGMINQPDYGHWEALKDLPWASRFKAPTPGWSRTARTFPLPCVQEIYEDLLRYAEQED